MLNYVKLFYFSLNEKIFAIGKILKSVLFFLFFDFQRHIKKVPVLTWVQVYVINIILGLLFLLFWNCIYVCLVGVWVCRRYVLVFLMFCHVLPIFRSVVGSFLFWFFLVYFLGRDKSGLLTLRTIWFFLFWVCQDLLPSRLLLWEGFRDTVLWLADSKWFSRVWLCVAVLVFVWYRAEPLRRIVI